jgi:hypothetical protein
LIRINWLKPMLFLTALLPVFALLAMFDSAHAPLWAPLALVPITCVAHRYHIAAKQGQYSALRVGEVVVLWPIGPYRISEVLPSTAERASYLVFSRGALGSSPIRALRFLDDVYVDVSWE